MNGELEHLTFHLSDAAIHAVAAGPHDGRLAILLHGYPEFWYGWRGQIGPLAEAGYRVVVPDQRGYNESSKPSDWRAYRLPNLTRDVLDIAAELGHDRFLLAGHDWGGIVAWACTIGHPDRIERVAILNAPHPNVFRDYLLTHPAQLLRSWYMFFMQLPWLPELLFEAADFHLMTATLAKTSRPGTFTERDFENYRQAWRQPGAVTGMVNWYRALRAGPKSLSNPRIEIPVTILWGAQDRFLASELAELSLQYCPRGTLSMFADCTHWLHHEEPAAVSQALTAFFSG